MKYAWRRWLRSLGKNSNYPRWLFEDELPQNMTPEGIHVSLRDSLIQAYKDDKKDLIEDIIKKFPDINYIDQTGKSLLMYIGQYKREVSIEDIQTKKNDQDKEELIKALKNKGADVNLKNSDGQTALFYASHPSDKELLIGMGADKGIKDNYGKTAENYLANKEFLEAYRVQDNLLDNELKVGLKPFTITHTIKELTALINKGADVNSKDNDGKTALIHAIRYSTNLSRHYPKKTDLINQSSEQIDLLLNNSADVNIKDKDGKTALIYAAENGNNEAVSKLIENRANVDIRDKDGKTALIYAAENGHKEAVSKLIENRANVDIQDKDDKTALMYAAMNGNYKSMEKLLDADANVKVKDADGKTVLDHLKEYKAKHPVSSLFNGSLSSIEKKIEAKLKSSKTSETGMGNAPPPILGNLSPAATVVNSEEKNGPAK